MFDDLLELSHQDDSNKSNIGFGEELTQVESVEVNFTHLIWSSVKDGWVLIAESSYRSKAFCITSLLQKVSTCPKSQDICDVICKKVPYCEKNIVGPDQRPSIMRGL